MKNAASRFVRGHAPRVFTEEWRRKISEKAKLRTNQILSLIAKSVLSRERPIGSTRINGEGYVLEKVALGKNGWKFQHRIVLEKKLGRALAPNEEPHHKNHIRSDNRPSNLKLKTKGKHQRMHAKEQMTGKVRDGLGRFA